MSVKIHQEVLNVNVSKVSRAPSQMMVISLMDVKTLMNAIIIDGIIVTKTLRNFFKGYQWVFHRPKGPYFENDKKCIDRIGTYECKCLPNYSGDGVDCEDIDECETKTHFCGSGGICTNLDGDHRCDCKDGYKKLTDDPYDGAIHRHGTCFDIDECAKDPNGFHIDRCNSLASCQNNEGRGRPEIFF